MATAKSKTPRHFARFTDVILPPTHGTACNLLHVGVSVNDRRERRGKTLEQSEEPVLKVAWPGAVTVTECSCCASGKTAPSRIKRWKPSSPKRSAKRSR